MVGRVASILLLVYWVGLATSTHVPGDLLGHAKFNDKVAHFTGYVGLAFLMCFAWATHRSFHRRTAFALWGAIMVYGAIDELLQIPVPGRTGELGDWIADAFGTLLGILFFSLVLGVVRRFRHRGM